MEDTRTFDAAVLVPYTSAGKYLLQHRADSVKRWPGYWGNFGGGVEEGEKVLHALQREMHEELGYEVRDPKFVFFQELPGGKKHVFIEQWSGNESFKLDLTESTAYGWFTLSEAQQLKIIPHDLEVLEKIANFLQQ